MCELACGRGALGIVGGAQDSDGIRLKGPIHRGNPMVSSETHGFPVHFHPFSLKSTGKTGAGMGGWERSGVGRWHCAPHSWPVEAQVESGGSSCEGSPVVQKTSLSFYSFFIAGSLYCGRLNIGLCCIQIQTCCNES